MGKLTIRKDKIVVVMLIVGSLKKITIMPGVKSKLTITENSKLILKSVVMKSLCCYERKEHYFGE